MKVDINRIKYFLTVGLFLKREHSSKRKNIAIRELQKFYLAVKFFFERNHAASATELSFSTIMAIVPIASMIFAIANGFGFGQFLEKQFREMLSAQPEAATWLLKLTQSYLIHAKTGIFIGIGLVIMLYSVFSLIRTVEGAFDSVWQVKGSRPLSRVIIDYTAMMFLVPISIIILSGLSIYFYSFVENLNHLRFLGTIASFSLRYLVPWTILTLMFIVLYVFMPNAKVKITKTIGPAMMASLAMLCLQAVYIHGQIFLTSYNAIYGSFAALPLFMLWILVSWYICLFCAELSYINQNLEYYECQIDTEDICHNDFMMMCATVLSHICQRFAKGEKPHTALQIKDATDIPVRITVEILYKLMQVDLVSENVSPTSDEVTYTPTYDTTNITVGEMIARLESAPESSKLDLLGFSPQRIWNHDIYNKVGSVRVAYLNELKSINIKELISNVEE